MEQEKYKKQIEKVDNLRMELKKEEKLLIELERIQIIERLILIMDDNQYWGGNHSNKRTVLRIRELLNKYLPGRLKTAKDFA